MLKEKTTRPRYLNILGSDGTLRETVEESSPGAIRREWKSGDGKSSGVKWERVYQELSGMITTIEMYDGDFGKNIIVGVTDGAEPEIKLSIATTSSFGEDFMKKLPNIDIKKPVILKPYSFIGDDGKPLKGITLRQDGNKITNYFYDAKNEKNLHNFPSPKFKIDKNTGEQKPFSKEEWKLYFGICRQFLIEYTEENHLLKNEIVPITNDEARSKYIDPNDDTITLDSIPF